MKEKGLARYLYFRVNRQKNDILKVVFDKSYQSKTNPFIHPPKWFISGIWKSSMTKLKFIPILDNSKPFYTAKLYYLLHKMFSIEDLPTLSDYSYKWRLDGTTLLEVSDRSSKRKG